MLQFAASPSLSDAKGLVAPPNSLAAGSGMYTALDRAGLDTLARNLRCAPDHSGPQSTAHGTEAPPNSLVAGPGVYSPFGGAALDRPMNTLLPGTDAPPNSLALPASQGLPFGRSARDISGWDISGRLQAIADDNEGDTDMAQSPEDRPPLDDAKHGGPSDFFMME
ncbi:hypothetical protein H4R21_005204 [Coemansia helicoidea]|uniref:Uncharacterized protein n=1 Tax=Coemansia helicoidea TaxID=1286919 RepID=A0ACC1KU86_9FUNG|nr:hypothetical protein H4R21_005204 [Coemansia helicoidea]